MDIKELKREFRYNGVKLADPNAEFPLVQVRDFYATVYPEIVSADIEGPEQVGAVHIYTFRRAVGTKGATVTISLDEEQLHYAAFAVSSRHHQDRNIADVCAKAAVICEARRREIEVGNKLSAMLYGEIAKAHWSADATPIATAG